MKFLKIKIDGHQTDQWFYEPIKLFLFSVIMRFLAWHRCMAWGNCPNCNSDAPKMRECKICNGNINSPFSWSRRKWYMKKWWHLFYFNAL